MDESHQWVTQGHLREWHCAVAFSTRDGSPYPIVKSRAWFSDKSGKTWQFWEIDDKAPMKIEDEAIPPLLKRWNKEKQSDFAKQSDFGFL